MTSISDSELIKAAESALKPQKLGDFYVADVGCALVTSDNQVFIGASVGGYLGICAEQGAVSQLVSSGETKIEKLVAVWRNNEGVLHALPPCGRCREFLRLLSSENLKTEIILGRNHNVKLKDLLPYFGWHAEEV